MSRKSLNQILQYLQPIPRHEGITDEYGLPESVPRKFPPLDKFKEILIERCRNVRFERKSSTVTLFDRLESLGLFDKVLSETVVEEIQTLLGVFLIEDRERSKDGNRSFRNFPLEFHRATLRSIYAHVLQVQDLLKRYQVGSEWLGDYMSAIRKQMIREVRALYPTYPIKWPPPRTLTDSADQLILQVYGVLDDILRSSGVGRGRKELSIHLTSVFCSYSEFFPYGFSSESVRKKVERHERFRTTRPAYRS